ncbi:MAG: sugar ABC transporter permease [Bacteroidetes bacterium]|nr:sugar ABC transporter permease [Bacteroidota bacterium]
MLNRKNTRVGLYFVAPLILFLAATTLFPLLHVLITSFFRNYLPERGKVFILFENFQKILKDEDFLYSMVRTSVYVISVTVVHIILAVLLALFFDKHTNTIGKISYIMRGLLIIPWLLSWTVAAAVWLLILNPSGVLNGFLRTWEVTTEIQIWLGDPTFAMIWIVIITVWKSLPFFFMLTYAALMTVSKELYESAVIDGAGSWRCFWSITLPMIKQTLLTLAVLDIVWCIRQYEVIAFTTGGGPLGSTKTLSVKIFQTAFENLRFGLASAQGVIVLLICSIIALAYIRIYAKSEVQQ